MVRPMTLVVPAPIKPMLAKRVSALPDGEGWLYEPKWDGFRALLFRDRDEWHLQSRDLKPLGRYFPELRQPILSQLPERVVLDGEIVIAKTGAGLDFETLLLRIHPAASRVALALRRRGVDAGQPISNEELWSELEEIYHAGVVSGKHRST